MHIFGGLFFEKRKKSSQDQGDEEEEETGNHASKARRWQEETGRGCGKGRRVERVASAGPAAWDGYHKEVPCLYICPLPQSLLWSIYPS